MKDNTVIQMLRQMQIDTAKSKWFLNNHVAHAWVIVELLGKKIQELGGKPYVIRDHMLVDTSCDKPDCFSPEKDNPYPLCLGRDYKKCRECQLRADWEPDDDPKPASNILLWEKETGFIKVREGTDKLSKENLKEGYVDYIMLSFAEYDETNLEDTEDERVLLKELYPDMFHGVGDVIRYLIQAEYIPDAKYTVLYAK